MNREQAIRELEEARHAADRRSFERYQALLLWWKGYSHSAIGETIGRSPSTIHNYVKAYKEGGLPGLEMGKSPGKPSKLSVDQQHVLKETIAYQTPADVGFPARYNWTLDLVVQFIHREWGITYTLRGASKLLHALGLSYTRPTYTLQQADPAKQQTFLEDTFPALKKADGW